MEKTGFYNWGQGFIGIIIVLVIAGLITGGFYYYLQKQMPGIPEISEKETAIPEETAPPPEEEKIEEITPQAGETTPTPELEKPTVQRCTDGTLYEQCSTNKPKYCEGGNLVEKASLCGCPENFRVIGDTCELLEDTNDIIVLEEEVAGEILYPPQEQDARWSIIDVNFLKQFYQTYSDNYDFIVLFPTKLMDNNHSVWITADAEGIGVELEEKRHYTDYTKKLKSIAELNYYSDWKDPFFNKRETDETRVKIMMHEIAHHWCCFISGWPGEGSNYPSQGIHWPSNLDLFYGDARYIDIMGYGQWIQDSGKDVCVGQTDTTQWKFSKLTQYLMGLVPPNQVAPIYLYEPKEDPNYHACGKYTTVNTYTITIENIIQANGVRFPSYENSQKSFRVAFVIVTSENEQVEQEFIDYVKLYKQALPNAWEKATEGKSHIIF